MSKTLQEMQIEVASYWAGVEEMKNCPWKLEKSYTTGQITPNRRVPNEYAPAWKVVGPYLQIEDGNPWSSAAILSRCGKEDQSAVRFLSSITNDKLGEDLFNKETYLIWSNTRVELVRLWKAGNLVLYYNIALQWLHKYAPDVWAKGMEALR